ncbi:amidase family protein [Nocardia sp. R6R-6]|uniref:amidase family protein n=1 Tax=Nocardia sp. R6R-6 TaxID=3459303 RepID=UPI00403DE83F
MTEVYELSAAQLKQAYREKRLSRREAVEASLSRCDLVNPVVNGVIYRFDERALREADEADRDAGDRSSLPLDGVPITVSEIYAVEGSSQPLGVPALEEVTVSKADDELVVRLREAGAIIVGKTAIPEGFFRWNTVSSLFGETLNARDTSRSAGGSGGGAATAVASGIVPIAFHGDGGGSLQEVLAGLEGVRVAEPRK